MPFNINSFKAEIENNGYLKNNQFEVIIAQPNVMKNSNLNYFGYENSTKGIVDIMRSRIDQVRAPAINLISADVPRYGIGPTSKVAIGTQINEVNFSVLVDGYGAIWQYWNAWLRQTFEFSGVETSFGSQSSRLPSYTANYKDDYSTIMQIAVFDNFGNTVQRINLYKAFPTSIREVPLSWDNNNTLLRLSISMSYSEHTIVGSALENFLAPQSYSTGFQVNQ